MTWIPSLWKHHSNTSFKFIFSSSITYRTRYKQQWSILTIRYWVLVITLSFAMHLRWPCSSFPPKRPSWRRFPMDTQHSVWASCGSSARKTWRPSPRSFGHFCEAREWMSFLKLFQLPYTLPMSFWQTTSRLQFLIRKQRSSVHILSEEHLENWLLFGILDRKIAPGLPEMVNHLSTTSVHNPHARNTFRPLHILE